MLVAYEPDLTRRAQALVLEALADGRLMVTAAGGAPALPGKTHDANAFTETRWRKS